MARKFVRVQNVNQQQLQTEVNDRSLAIGVDNPHNADMSTATFIAETQPDVMRTQPAEAFNPEHPDSYPVWHGAKGFTANLDDPMRTIKQDSLPANLIHWLLGKTDEAVQVERNKYRLDPNVIQINKELGALEDAGKVDSPEYSKLMDELSSIEGDLQHTETDGKFSFASLKQAYNKDPGAFAANFVNELAKDPELLLTPLGWRTAATRTGAIVERLGASAKAVSAAETVGGATGVAATGAAVSGGITAGEQLKQSGAITDPEEIKLNAEFGAATAVILTGAFKGLESAVAKSAKLKTPTPEGAPPPPPTEPLDPLARVDTTIRLNKAAAQGELAKEIAALEKVVAEDKAAADHGARIEVLQGVDFGEQVLKNIDEAVGFNQIEAAAGRPRTTMEQAFYDAMSRNRQAGKADIKTLAATSLIGLGALTGASFSEDRIKGALGGAGAAVGTILAGRTLVKLGEGMTNAFKYITAPDNRIRIDHLTNQWEGDIATGYRSSWQVKQAILKDVPDVKRREAITHWLEGDKSIKLDAKEVTVANQIRGIFDKLGAQGREAEVLSSFLENYVPHFWRQGGASKSEIINKLTEKFGGGGMSTKTVHAKQRVIPTLREGIDAGLKPQTLDIAKILKTYTDSLYRAIRNKQLAEALKNEISPTGMPLVMSTAGKPETTLAIAAVKESLAAAKAQLKNIEARVAAGKSGNLEAAQERVWQLESRLQGPPADYVPINHPQFVGHVVHPDIAPSLNFIYHSSDPNIIQRGVLALNFAAKRSLVSMSFFHANALLESMVLAGVSPHKIVPALKQLASGRAGDIVDEALRAGLKIGAIEDVGTDVFYSALKDIENVVNDILPVVGGAAVRGIDRLNRTVDHIMWDKIATGGKLAIFMHEMEKAVLNNAAKHAADPAKNALIPREQLAADVANYVNDAMGGLNWRRIAEGVQNKLGRDIALAAFNPGGRKMMQLLMFAPDWTIANIRVLLKAIPGVAKNKRITRMHQYYAARGALYFATIGSAINMMYTGKPIWKNSDPTMIDLGDGRKMVFSKQFVEPWHWLTKPGYSAINKLGILPKTALELSKGVKYFTGHSSDPPLYADDATFWEKQYGNLSLLGKKFTPIFAQQVADQGVSGIAGFLGHPIYGTKQE